LLKVEASFSHRSIHRHPVFRRSLIAAVLSAPFIARAEAIPSQPIRVIVPGAPGGVVDLAARAIGEAMETELGQPWRVDPRPGANGLVAAKAFLDAPADSSALYLTVLSHVLLPFMMKVPFDLADFQPVAMVGSTPFLLCVPATSAVDSVAGFVHYAHAHPGRLNYLNPGNGTVPHLLPEMLKARCGLDIAAVYYKAVAQGIADLIAGDLDLAVLGTGLALPHVRQVRLKAIAQVSRHPLDSLRGIPTLGEQGFSDLEIEGLLPLYGRTAMPAAAVERINRAMASALADHTTLQRLAAAGIEPLPMSAAESGVTLQREHDRLGAVIRQLGIGVEDPGGSPS
jgi:tripartite-type tricarboxylate transporter receptor subunit TctC